jgi:hypothetical protein
MHEQCVYIQYNLRPALSNNKEIDYLKFVLNILF